MTCECTCCHERRDTLIAKAFGSIFAQDDQNQNVEFVDKVNIGRLMAILPEWRVFAEILFVETSPSKRGFDERAAQTPREERTELMHIELRVQMAPEALKDYDEAFGVCCDQQVFSIFRSTMTLYRAFEEQGIEG
ncbi:predicted protein [Pyrenophora tritici-repentis Pt-1C-BFP]|uniref:Uncharacterized protein n=1 Tax=Pyrenophora tritici-repentis (strain Pt-1C-BFP) TaxID=426418 RepID=B2W2V0_PYRTR|nr:uncharacterized protein PTRG_03748 [Pyrenophora tritici-repentis Pt-1C-BFP]EDU46586.1 predicted protein [Pyrenophora tritici-repentis Pt-1C-BFP]